MNAVRRLLVFEARDLLRGRWLAVYSAFFLLAGFGLLRLGGGDARAVLGLTNIVLFVVPLVSLVFGTTRVFDAREFTELLLSQPVARRELFSGLYGGLVIGLSVAFLFGAGAPFLFWRSDALPVGTLLALLGAGVSLTLVFVAIALLIALATRDKARALAAAIGVWLLATVVYDGAVLFVASALARYPLERPMIGLMLLNPVDLARVFMLMRLDVAALMGYTGAVFQRFFDSVTGTALLIGALGVWTAVPVVLGLRSFARRDFTG